MSTLTVRHSRLIVRDLATGLRLNVLIFAAIFVVIFAVVGLIVALTGSLDGSTWDSVWENSAYGTRYFPLSLGIMLAPAYLPICVASGMTRRSFAIAAGIVVMAIAFGMALLEAAGYAVEYGLFQAAGGVQDFQSPHLFSDGLDVFWILLEVTITVGANVMAGYLIGAAYYRWGWFGPTLALPLLVAPTLAVEALMSVGWPGGLMIDTWGIERAPLAVVIPGSLAIIALNWWIATLITRTMPIRARKN